MSESEVLLSCRSLECGYVGRPVLHDVSFQLHAGEILALLGPNGSGKSTLLKALVKNIDVAGGSVEVLGAPLAGLPYRELARRVAFVPQDEHVQFPFLVREIVMMGRMPHSAGLTDSRDDQEIVVQAMKSADCIELESRTIQELSGGEKQRVWIGRALAQKTRILLLDEPTAHLDVAHQLSLVTLLRRLASEGYGIVAAIHDLNTASILADRMLLLKGGTVGMLGTSPEVLRDPMLDDVYGVRFERHESLGGPFRVFPEISD